MSQQAYQARIPIYPRTAKGKFRNIKYGVLVLAYGVYFLLPWLRWERESGPAQAVLFDIVGRHFYLFDLVVYAQDIFWLAGILIIAAVLMFFVTGLAGRVFCGYFCFQTLWTDVYILIERLVQGERHARMKLAKAPWGAEKIIKIGTTHLLWLGMALLTGLTFTLYWESAPALLLQMLRGEAPFAAYATTLFLTTTTYVMAGLAREQVCTYMCPYARFQGVMFDQDTLIVAYDEARGEREQGRRKPSKGYMGRDQRIANKVGDCIDCGYCVQVCPTGIDIRNGLQYQCISCALCIDACNTIMDSIGFPPGLIRYSSEKAMRGEKSRLLKIKNIAYGAVLAIAITTLIWSIVTRSVMEMAVRQVRQPLSVTLSDGRIQNRYEVKLNNKTSQAVLYKITLKGLKNAELDLSRSSDIVLLPQSSVTLNAKVRMHPSHSKVSRQNFFFEVIPLSDAEDETVRRKSMFYIPKKYLK